MALDCHLWRIWWGEKRGCWLIKHSMVLSIPWKDAIQAHQGHHFASDHHPMSCSPSLHLLRCLSSSFAVYPLCNRDSQTSQHICLGKRTFIADHGFWFELTLTLSKFAGPGVPPQIDYVSTGGILLGLCSNSLHITLDNICLECFDSGYHDWVMHSTLVILECLISWLSVFFSYTSLYTCECTIHVVTHLLAAPPY